ncbi:uncharacterized protein AB675_3439 [Cyphellophora attinorum]|uniref:DNA ligase D 3'-phosphoesterase domain-containing protein n=1 Tax=Cyphellophora attinorum TaxID=1664694 RepID=A0A0N1HAF3_9EURO|nr:uncharacterized protein AB675_3439 [Phialophora attinorum]KPI39590.1 hypothetical protein AB675_3439 [Phialophora attinorum]
MKRDHSEVQSSDESYVTAEDNAATPESRARPSTLARGVSPPRVSRANGAGAGRNLLNRKAPSDVQPSTAQVEAGIERVDDHVAFFSKKLSAFTLPLSSLPRLAHVDWLDLYDRNLSSSGHHFVIHQHDHPVAGTHYDLRLQINATSSISFAIMYGLPGDPNSKRLNRNATETRVHCLWNHLIETASPQTGTMLIWDTGEYEVLQRVQAIGNGHSDTETESDPESSFQSDSMPVSEPDRLASAFSSRKIRLRLHGTRLPKGYTLYIRLTKENDRSQQPKAPAFKRRRRAPDVDKSSRAAKASTPLTSSSSSSEDERSLSPDRPSDSTDNTQATRNSTHRRLRRNVSSLERRASPPPQISHVAIAKTTDDKPQHSEPVEAKPPIVEQHSPSGRPDTTHAHGDEVSAALKSAADDRENEREQEQIRLQNVYPGATNSVNSIHQRKWYLSLDRTLSGFVSIPTPSHIRNHHAKTYWIPVGSLSSPHSNDVDIKTARTTTSNGHSNADAIRDPVLVLQNDAKTDKQHRLLKANKNACGFARFHVLGREHERSIVTGRLAADILSDEGVERYVPRALWRAVIE